MLLDFFGYSMSAFCMLCICCARTVSVSKLATNKSPNEQHRTFALSEVWSNARNSLIRWAEQHLTMICVQLVGCSPRVTIELAHPTKLAKSNKIQNAFKSVSFADALSCSQSNVNQSCILFRTCKNYAYASANEYLCCIRAFTVRLQ